MRRIILTAVGCLAVVTSARAEILPSFHVQDAGARATHVVVVNPGGEVLESWRGDLKVGDKVPTEGAPLDSPVHHWDTILGTAKLKPPADALRSVSGERRVFFLVRDETKGWRPANMYSEMDVSVAWLEKGQAFAIQQWMNPGPALMMPLKLNEKQLKAEVDHLTSLREQIAAALKEPDTRLRAEKLTPILKTGNWILFEEARKGLYRCGENAWPAMQKALADDAYLPAHKVLLQNAHDLVGKEVLQVVEQIVRDETEYWKEESQTARKPQTLPRHALNQVQGDHYDRLVQCLLIMQETEYRDTKGIVATLREQLKSSPNLAGLGARDSGNSPLILRVNEILQAN